MAWTSADDNAARHLDAIPRTFVEGLDADGNRIVSGWFPDGAEQARREWGQLERFAGRVEEIREG